MVGDFYGYVEEDNCAGSDVEGGIKAYDLAVVMPQMSPDEAIRIFLGADNGTDMTLKRSFYANHYTSTNDVRRASLSSFKRGSKAYGAWKYI